jgi:hypothetical protein
MGKVSVDPGPINPALASDFKLEENCQPQKNIFDARPLDYYKQYARTRLGATHPRSVVNFVLFLLDGRNA